MSTTKKTSNSHDKFTGWTFGIYRAKNPGRAVLGITFPAAEDGTPQTLILDASQSQKPSMVAEALFNAGALINLEADKNALAQALDPKSMVSGRFITKLGVIDDSFLTTSCAYGPSIGPYMLEPTLLDRAAPHFRSKGAFDDWSKTVLELAGHSSFLMFVIMQALAAPLLKRVTAGADEGFIINLAGDTSRGKTTALMVGKSVSGSPFATLTWKNTERTLIENAAALSDTLLAIDDLDKISSSRSFSSNFSQLTHLLTSGASKGYARNVQKSLPNLTWTCCALTCARATIDELSTTTGYVRQGHERVRCIDIKVPGPEVGGIWDRQEGGKDPSELTAEMQSFLAAAYGTALPQWLSCVHDDEDIIKDARELIEYFVKLIDINTNDGLSHRVAKKFGLIYAAGILAQEHGIIPWSRDDIKEITCGFFDEAAKTLHNVAAEVDRGLQQLQQRLSEKPTVRRFADQERPTFARSTPPSMFIKKSGYVKELCITRSKFHSLFVSEHVGTAALERLQRNQIVISGSAQKRIRLTKVKPDSAKVRYMVFNLDLLDKFFSENGRSSS